MNTPATQQTFESLRHLNELATCTAAPTRDHISECDECRKCFEAFEKNYFETRKEEEKGEALCDFEKL